MNLENEYFVLLMYHAKRNNQVIANIEESNYNLNADNFTSRTIKLTAWYNGKDNERYKRVLFVKSKLPRDSPQNQIVNCDIMFENEIYTYETVLPTLQAVNNQIKLPFPNCIVADRNNLILEDLCEQQFSMSNKMYGLTFDESSLALKNLAEYHSRSISMKTCRRNEYDGIVANLKESVFLKSYIGQKMEAYWENCVWCAQQSITEFTELSVMLEKYTGCVLKTLISALNGNEKFSVICHGDLWCNNLMFRRQNSGKVRNVCFVDLQATRHASCTLDVLCLLCSSTECGLIGRKFHELIMTYYLALKSCCKRYNINVPFTFEEFENEMKNNTFYGLIIGAMFILNSTKENNLADEELQDMESLMGGPFRQALLQSLTFQYHNRIRQLLIDLKDLNLLY